MRDHQAQIGYNDVQLYIEGNTIEDYTDVRAAIPIYGDILCPECSDLLSLEEFEEKFKIACPSPNNR